MVVPADTSPQPAAESTVQAPAVEASAPPSNPSTQSVDMNDFLRDVAGTGATLNPNGVRPTAELNGAASAESALDGDVSADDGDGSGGAATPGRRSRRAQQDQATIQQLQSELQQYREQFGDQSPQAAARKAVYDLIGTDEQYRALLEVPDEQLTNQQYQTREAWKANRRVYRPLEQAYEHEQTQRADRWVQGVLASWGQRTLSVADRYGLDRAFLADPKNTDIASLLEHAVQRTEARLRAEYAERVSQTERDRDAARSEALVGRRAPVTNGAASGAAGTSTDMNEFLRGLGGVRTR